MTCDPTIDELLSEPIIRKLMARDGVRAEEIRSLLDEARGRGRIAAPSLPTILPVSQPNAIQRLA